MTLQERLAIAHQHAVSLYLRRTEIETQRQQLMVSAQQCDIELVKTDGAIEALTAAIAGEQKAAG